MQLLKTVIGFSLISMILNLSVAYAQDSYIEAELLDFDKIREEEQLSENIKIERVYIFLAIKKGASFEAYAANGEGDLDNDSKKAIEEPNDLAEYENLISFDKSIEIAGDSHISYITDLPYFDKLFPEHADPFEKEGIIEVQVKTKDDAPAKMTGSITFPLIGEDGSQNGIERFIAFYNKGMTDVKDKDGKPTGKKAVGNNVVSYGFIEILMSEET